MRICKYTNRTNFYLIANKHLQGHILAGGIQDAALKAGHPVGLQALCKAVLLPHVQLLTFR